MQTHGGRPRESWSAASTSLNRPTPAAQQVLVVILSPVLRNSPKMCSDDRDHRKFSTSIKSSFSVKVAEYKMVFPSGETVKP